MEKIESLGINKLDSFDALFSSKEKEIISEMFGIESIHTKNTRTKVNNYTNSVEVEKNIDDIQQKKKRRNLTFY